MNDYNREERNNPCCNFHPKQQLVGVCPLCLNERLLILVAKQGLDNLQNHRSRSAHHSSHTRSGGGGPDLQRKPSLSFSKIFTLGSLLHYWKSHDSPDIQDIGTSLEDSFISIKFEENGVASWDKGKVSKLPLEKSNNLLQSSCKAKGAFNNGVVEINPKPRDSLRWRERAGELLKLIKWRRSNKNKANVVEMSMVEDAVKGKTSWLMRRRRRRRNNKEY
ncbi:hypothetical protein Dimus_024684 [Dionaea muscipula]